MSYGNIKLVSIFAVTLAICIASFEELRFVFQNSEYYQPVSILVSTLDLIFTSVIIGFLFYALGKTRPDVRHTGIGFALVGALLSFLAGLLGNPWLQALPPTFSLYLGQT